jgi:Ca2+-binding EF-hand superfamily protein
MRLIAFQKRSKTMHILKLLVTTSFIAAMVATPALAHDHKDGSGKAGHYFMMMDEDGNGEITQAEYTAAMEKKFVEVDADANGILTKEEVEAHMKAMHEKKHDKMMEEESEKPAE